MPRSRAEVHTHRAVDRARVQKNLAMPLSEMATRALRRLLTARNTAKTAKILGRPVVRFVIATPRHGMGPQHGTTSTSYKTDLLLANCAHNRTVQSRADQTVRAH